MHELAHAEDPGPSSDRTLKNELRWPELNFQPPRYHGQVADRWGLRRGTLLHALWKLCGSFVDQHCYAFQRQKELRHIQQQLSLRGRQDPAQSEQERQKQLMANKESAEKILGMITGHIESLQSSPLRLASLMNIHVPLHCTDDTLEAVAALSNLPNDSEIRKTLRGVRRWCASLVQMQNLPGTDETFGGMVKTVFKLLSSQFYKPEMIQTRPDCVSVLHVVTEVLLCTLDRMGTSPHLKKQLSDTLLQRLDDMEAAGTGMLQLDVVAGILRYRLVQVADFDRMMSRWMDGRRQQGQTQQINLQSTDFVIQVLQRCCLEHRTHFGKDFQKWLNRTSLRSSKNDPTAAEQHISTGASVAEPSRAFCGELECPNIAG
eukprot:symbB.v1.2.007589.t1/scaffold386.1/size215569/15